MNVSPYQNYKCKNLAPELLTLFNLNFEWDYCGQFPQFENGFIVQFDFHGMVQSRFYLCDKVHPSGSPFQYGDDFSYPQAISVETGGKTCLYLPKGGSHGYVWKRMIEKDSKSLIRPYLLTLWAQKHGFPCQNIYNSISNVISRHEEMEAKLLFEERMK